MVADVASSSGGGAETASSAELLDGVIYASSLKRVETAGADMPALAEAELACRKPLLAVSEIAG